MNLKDRIAFHLSLVSQYMIAILLQVRSDVLQNGLSKSAAQDKEGNYVEPWSQNAVAKNLYWAVEHAGLWIMGGWANGSHPNELHVSPSASDIHIDLLNEVLRYIADAVDPGTKDWRQSLFRYYTSDRNAFADLIDQIIERISREHEAAENTLPTSLAIT